ncbi:MAG TPA: 16S rRNA (cytosine(1402)-N(4))-methyltransferase RsmH [Lacipirellula sp.]
MNDSTVHVPVLLAEVVEYLRPTEGGVFVDGTLGGGGHTRALAERVGASGRVIALDLDPEPVRRAEQTLAGLPVAVAASSYTDVPEVLDELSIEAVDGILLDLGLSSDQLAEAQRGFSFQSEGELDLRFDPEQGEPAWKMLARLSEETLADVIYHYGEERFSRRIARRIIEERRSTPIRTAAQLAALVRSCIPRSRGHDIDPATRTFQALRIAVNSELDNLKLALRRLPDRLKPDGRLAIISFHSLEDRLVKEAFRDDPRLTVVTRKPVIATDDEISRNPRARSAKLRVAQRAGL